ncbi:glycosyltransferase family 39 protein [Mesorhizobium sp. NBSH29]|uniref:glycosyltransferase family 39 protein n=1 Tax=Mesorhizobium sp. NBSH29 TaxID=2654249 RepID=UPI00189669D2|nr:glycosyltransferase family 39 protein [Mesorhizobium sp. NBSH29]
METGEVFNTVKTKRLLHLRKDDWPIAALAILFVLKTFCIAIWVTPLWGIPDEVGHYAYAEDIALGRGFPELGKATISAEVNTSAQNKTAGASHNWIAQHPPIYYVIAAVPIRIAVSISNDKNLKFISPRLIAVVAGGAILLILYKTLLLIGLNRDASTAVAASISLVPQFSTLASGTNHDVPLMFISALSAYFFVRFVLLGARVDAYWCAFLLSMAAATKFTALVMLAPVVSFLIIEYAGSARRKIEFGAKICALSLLLPGLWFARNVYLFGSPFFDELDRAKPSDALEGIGFLEFLRTYPVVENFFVNFLGWFGGGKTIRAFQLYGWPLEILSLVVLGFFAVLSVEACRLLFKQPDNEDIHEESIIVTVSRFFGSVVGSRRDIIVSAVLIATIAFVVVVSARGDAGTNYVRSFAGILLMFSAIIAFAIPIFGTPPTVTRLFAYCLVIVGFFSTVLLIEIFEVSQTLGTMRATNGRYLYPVVPFALIAFGIAAAQWRAIRICATPAVILMAYLEMETYLSQVVPFYG